MTKEKALKEDKKEELEVIFPPNPESSRMLVGCRHDEYLASRIAYAVEDAEAQVLNLNVTSLDYEGYQVVVSLRVNRRNPDPVIRSLERYGYDVIGLESVGISEDEDVLRSRYDELMRLLSV